MTPAVVDASALGAVVFQEPGCEEVARRLRGRTVYAPALLRFELASIAWKKARQRPADMGRLLTALALATDDGCGIVWHRIDPTDVVLVAFATKLSTYDASYLWLAGYLGANLVTLDGPLSRAGAAIAV
jgi:predicted nucleic acid-binding protein